mgnify:CR=1 FL=1
MTFFAKPLVQRILSAIILIPLVIAAFWADGWVLIGLLVLGWGLAMREWIGLMRAETLFLKMGFLSLGLVIFTAMALGLWGLSHDFSHGVMTLIIILAAVWLSDTGAYAMGRLIGGPKLCPVISPNKTWAGLVGACLAPMALLLFFEASIHMAIIGLVFGMLAQAGDLSISHLKRQAGVKDSGRLIPGHGGLLDRIDSMIFVVPYAYFICLEFGYG